MKLVQLTKMLDDFEVDYDKVNEKEIAIYAPLDMVPFSKFSDPMHHRIRTMNEIIFDKDTIIWDDYAIIHVSEKILILIG